MATWKTLKLKVENIEHRYKNAVLIRMPSRSNYKGYTFYHPKKLINEFDGEMTIAYTEDFKFKIFKKGIIEKKEVELTASEMRNSCKNLKKDVIELFQRGIAYYMWNYKTFLDLRIFSEDCYNCIEAMIKYHKESPHISFKIDYNLCKNLFNEIFSSYLNDKEFIKDENSEFIENFNKTFCNSFMITDYATLNNAIAELKKAIMYFCTLNETDLEEFLENREWENERDY